jgi:acetoin utilization deacetylase AcuC-like enzyme
MPLPPLVSNPNYSFPFSLKHRFPMAKFGLLQDYLRERQLLTTANHFRPGAAKAGLIELAHCPSYVNSFINNTLDKTALRRMGLPWSEALVRRSITAVNGSFLTAQLALKYGLACHLAGGTHHAHYDFGSGFCIFNDLAITAKALIAQQKVAKILIFDCDVHQGDGTATLLASEDSIFTCSVHCDKNFPARKAISDLDIDIPKGCRDQTYLDIIEAQLLKLLAEQQPDLVIYDAGVDVYSGDPLGLLDISLEGIRTRDRMVMQLCLSRNIPIATVIGGGYDRDHKALAARHAIVIEEATKLYQ